MKSSDDLLSTYRNTLVSVKEKAPPEELLATLTGAYGRWQICLTVMAFVCEAIHGLNIYSITQVEPQGLKELNYTCADGSGAKCVDVHGKPCKNFTFQKPYNMTTFTEQYSLICVKKELGQWIATSFLIGLTLSYIITGFCADKFGRKCAALMFVPLQCLTGGIVLTASETQYEALFILLLIHGLFSTALNLIPKVAICDAVGNNWRTFALGFTVYPFPVSKIMLAYFIKVFKDIGGLIGTVSSLPIILLIPLLYFRDSPIFLLLTADFEKAEEALRKIAAFNKRPFPGELRIRPVEVIDAKDPKRNSYVAFLKSSETRGPFFALIFLWTFHGFCYSIYTTTTKTASKSVTDAAILALPSFLGGAVAIILCHLIHHKIVFCIFTLLKNVALAILLLVQNRIIQTTNNRLVVQVLKLVTCFLFYLSYTTLDNLTPRMFPTGYRSQGLGLCFSVFHIGNLLTNLADNVPHERIIWVLGPFLVIIGPIFETLSSFWLWKVHKRELPDFFEDSLHFKNYYKPLRHLSIHDDGVIEDEIEVKLMDFEKSYQQNRTTQAKSL